MILERLKKGVVLGDGGAVFELERRGYLSAGPFTPEVVIERPEVVRQMQVDFARAGSNVLQACTYYAHKEKLRDRGVESSLHAINATAVRIARDVANDYDALVAGNISNTWIYNPQDSASFRETRSQYDEQIEFQLPHGTDFFIAETIEYLGEARIALEAIRQAGQPAMITLGFRMKDHTREGVVLEDAVKELEDLGADIVGLNCFRDPKRMLPFAKRVREAVSCPVATQPVAYRCTDDKPYFQIQEFDGRLAFPLELDPFTLTRVEMAAYAVEAQELGINYIGACCGTGPHHIRAMAEALGRSVPNSKYSPRLELHTIIGNEAHVRERNSGILCAERHGDAKCHFIPQQEKGSAGSG